MLFSRVFRVLSDSLRDRGVDFLTVNIDEKSCYFRVFFACFLTDCKTGVLIFSCYAERRVLVHHEQPKIPLHHELPKILVNTPSQVRRAGS